MLDRADASYAQIRHQAAQEKCMAVAANRNGCRQEQAPGKILDRRSRKIWQTTEKRFSRAAGILLAVVILSATAVSAAAVGIVGYRRYMAERMTDIGTEELGHLEMVAEQGNVTAEFSRELTARERSIYEQLTREYDGQELAYCISDARFYEPERELTDEEMLQLIDLEHKNQYIFERIGREIECGKRAGWPQTYHLQ